MKKKEKQSLRGMSEAELVKHINVLEAETMRGMLDRATKEIKNIRTFRTKRREIAVGKTVVRQRQLAA